MPAQRTGHVKGKLIGQRIYKRCYCVFCRSPRFVYVKKHISILDFFLATGAALLASFIVFQDFDPRAIVFLAISLGIAELFIIFRWRLSISCPHCGFDPVVYKKNSEKAVNRVKQHMRERREDPLSAFSPPPRLPVLRKRSPEASQ